MKRSLYLRLCLALARRLFPSCDTVYEEVPDEEPGVYLCNHAGAIGPILMTLYFPKAHRTWTIDYALDKKKSAYYFAHDAFLLRSRKIKGFWKVLSAVMVKFLRPLLLAGKPIPVHHSTRMIETFRESENALENGESLVIFPEEPREFSPYVHRLYEGFADLGRAYYLRTGKRLRFYPVYAEKKNRKILVGAPIVYDPTAPAKPERKRIAEGVRDEIDRLARTLPKHKPIPFLSPKWYRYYGEYENDPASYWKLFDDPKKTKREEKEKWRSTRSHTYGPISRQSSAFRGKAD